MRQLAAATLAIALGLAAALALVACGGGENAKLLPGTTARQITENLAAVRSLAAEGECVAAQDAAQAVGNQVDDLTGIDPKLEEALQRGTERLNEVVLTCTEETTEEETEEAPPTTETAPTKPRKEKPGRERHEEEAKAPGTTEPSKSEAEPPKGKAEGHEAPPPETGPEPPSGGIGPGAEAGGGG
jgi:hypothetical protein